MRRLEKRNILIRYWEIPIEIPIGSTTTNHDKRFSFPWHSTESSDHLWISLDSFLELIREHLNLQLVSSLLKFNKHRTYDELCRNFLNFFYLVSTNYLVITDSVMQSNHERWSVFYEISLIEKVIIEINYFLSIIIIMIIALSVVNRTVFYLQFS